MSVNVDCIKSALLFNAVRKRLFADMSLVLLNRSLNLLIRVQINRDVIHHVKILLLTELLNLGNNLSCKALFLQLRCNLCIEDDKDILLHSNGESFLCMNLNIDIILLNLGILAVQVHGYRTFFQCCGERRCIL